MRIHRDFARRNRIDERGAGRWVSASGPDIGSDLAAPRTDPCILDSRAHQIDLTTPLSCSSFLADAELVLRRPEFGSNNGVVGDFEPGICQFRVYLNVGFGRNADRIERAAGIRSAVELPRHSGAASPVYVGDWGGVLVLMAGVARSEERRVGKECA